MGTNIEAVIVGQKLGTITRMEVTCIFCGLPTPVPTLDLNKFASNVPRRISIVRCNVCGKEAPYRACDVFGSARSVERETFNPRTSRQKGTPLIPQT